ncbi:MAG TPA: hypothetical protein P5277_01845 [Candidatus Paceibacterota bacterium]|nr:hypothetical protein [Candidatus Paceibacterota bacterium]
MKSKKGLSDIITTVLMILLVIAAIAVLWVVIQNFVSKGTGEVASVADCMNTILDVSKADVSADEIRVARKTGGGKIDGYYVFVKGIEYKVTGDIVTGGYDTLNPSTDLGVTLSAGDDVDVTAIIAGKTCPKKDGSSRTAVA